MRSAILALALSLTVLHAGCGGPFLMIPGGALSGKVVAEPVTDWSFADDAFVDVEFRPEEPYSVELNYRVREGRLYLDPAEGRTWLEYLRADPRVRLRFGDSVYEAEAVLVEDPAEFEGFDPTRFVYRIESRPRS